MYCEKCRKKSSYIKYMRLILNPFIKEDFCCDDCEKKFELDTKRNVVFWIIYGLIFFISSILFLNKRTIYMIFDLSFVLGVIFSTVVIYMIYLIGMTVLWLLMK